ncbi:MAG: polyphosphate kinase 1 [Pseudomonadota bacterium]|nr:polyphosphate kinase 1 [Pseudomonadota bacterium]
MSTKYINRELSYLAFVRRIIQVAADDSTPLLEKLRFLIIINTCLDEFFMVRVSSVRKHSTSKFSDSPERMLIAELCPEIQQQVKEINKLGAELLAQVIIPRLNAAGIQLATYQDLPSSARSALRQHFCANILPILTPMVFTQPLPYFDNLEDYLLVTTDTEGQLGCVEIPANTASLIAVSDNTYITLIDLITNNLQDIFIGHEIEQHYQLRVTRDWNYELIEDNVMSLLSSIEEINNSERAAVRLEVASDMPTEILQKLTDTLQLGALDLYDTKSRAVQSLGLLLKDAREDLIYKPFNPRLPRRLVNNKNIFKLIASGDLLVHHPFESFYTVVEFLHEAALDEHTVAIKQTLYRTSDESRIVDSLIAAAENGKKVTAFIEIKARFDEENNIQWAKRLEKAGVRVVCGFIYVKTHLKTTIVARREGEKITQYVHLSTGNYNSSTAKTYTDIGLFTANEEYGKDLSLLFNLLTSYNLTWNERKQHSSSPKFSKLSVAPFALREKIIFHINHEISCQRQHGTGLIIAKMNALVDKDIIDCLYAASQAGVKIKLIVRGVCCLIPQVKGLSDNITVSSTVGRFLEHSRIFYFYAKGARNLYLSSADWMPRNMDKRVEAMYPILEERLKKQIIEFILPIYLNDSQAWSMRADGTYVRRLATSVASGADASAPDKSSAHELLISYARESGIKSLPYEIAIRHTDADHPIA